MSHLTPCVTCFTLSDLKYLKRNYEKVSAQLNCLGIIVDTKEITLSIPRKKNQEILDTYNAWHYKTHCTKHQLQSLLGSLLYISKCVRSSRLFLNRLLGVLRSMEDRSQVPITLEAKRDINWFIQFLPKLNGVTFFDYRPINAIIELDVSLQGLGARGGDQVYSPGIPLGYMNFHIAHIEMLNMLAAIKIWHNEWSI